MEKFGIFELLDTLSALSAPQSGEQTDVGAPANTGENSAPQTEADASPSLSGERPDPKLSAFESLISRHEGISKRIDKNK